MPTDSDRPWAIRAPVETTACTSPASIMRAMIRPILAMVMAPDRVSTTLQAGSRAMAMVTSKASPRARPPKVVGLLAAVLAYGNVRQIKRSIAAVLEVLGPRPARATRHLEPRELARRLAGFRHRFNDGRDVACLLLFIRQMLERGSIESFFLE